MHFRLKFQKKSRGSEFHHYRLYHVSDFPEASGNQTIYIGIASRLSLDRLGKQLRNDIIITIPLHLALDKVHHCGNLFHITSLQCKRNHLILELALCPESSHHIGIKV